MSKDRNRLEREKTARQNAALEAIRQANRSTARVIPKGHPLSPQIEDKAVKPKDKPLYSERNYTPNRKLGKV